MRRQLLCTVSVTAITLLTIGSGMAADMPRKAAPAPVPFIAAPTFAGFYVGGHAGYAWSKHNYTGDDAETFPGGPGAKLKGFAGGVHAGYNWQFTQWVLGLEGDWTWTGRENTIVESSGTDTRLTRKRDWLGSIRGRLGMTFDRTLVYATGGVAWMHGKSTLASTLACAACATWTRTGGVVGGGVEWKPDPNWSLRLEGLYYIFNRDIVLPGPGSGSAATSGQPTDQINNAAVVRVGFSYYPGWGK